MMNKFILYIVLIFTATNSYCQSDSIVSQREVIIIKTAELPVMSAIKMTNNPSIEDAVIPAPTIKYSVVKKQIPVTFEIDPIKPARMKGEPLNSLSRAYLKGGFGNYTNTLFEGYVNNSRSRKHAIGASVKHFASQGGINDVGYNGFSHNEATIFGKKFLKKHLIQGQVNYDRDALRYYGYDPIEFDGYTKENTKQWFSRAGADIRFMSFIKDSTKLNYEANLSYYNLIDKGGLMENNGKLTVNLRKYYIPQDSSIVTDQIIRLHTSLDYNNFYNGYESNGSGIFMLYPHFTASGDKFRVNFGGTMFVEAFDNDANFHFYPKAEIKYNVVRNLLIPYAGVRGGIERNSYNSLTSENPFLVTYSSMLNSKTPYDAYGGVRGAFSSKMAFNIMGNRKRIVNMPFFTNRYDLGFNVDLEGDINYYRWGGNTFNIIYDTVDVTTIDAQLSYITADKINVIVRGEYYIYQLKNEVEAWHMPDWKTTLSGTYNVKDKILIRADIFAISSRQALTYDRTSTYIGLDAIGVEQFSQELPWIIDINLGVEYRYNKKLSAFVNFNNIASMNYYQWNKYPSQGFNVMGGLTYSFWEK
jgi:hypothetical protein